MSSGGLSVIVAVQSAEQNLPEIVRALDCERHLDVEFLICHAGADPQALQSLAGRSNVRVLASPAGSLVPQLWRDGILAARCATVAMTTAHCIPDDDWLACLLQADLRDLAGIGGVIENHPDSDAKGWAIFLQRYVPFAPPQEARRVAEIAADNAAYRRAEILRHADLLQEGFWEPSFHARFRDGGLALALEPRLRVYHRNCYGARQFFRQRYDHGREFGLTRAVPLSALRRCLLLAASPLLPLVFLRKILVRAMRHPASRRQIPRAAPWLLFFLLGWGLGEARGYLESISRR